VSNAWDVSFILAIKFELIKIFNRNHFNIRRVKLKKSLTLILFCVIVIFVSSSSSFAQQLVINELEKRISDLEIRVAALEKMISSPKVQNIEVKEKWKNRSLWRQLKLKMSMDEVESLLGIPKKIDGGAFTRWDYSSETWHSYVMFYKGELDSWTEPQ
jgi:outer membrane protein assembly factor BamE (lipoprotein component of BamABCDE complex)